MLFLTNKTCFFLFHSHLFGVVPSSSYFCRDKDNTIRTMILSTTPTIEGRPIREYKGIVTGEVIIGANAVVGIDLDYETIGANGSMLMVSSSGTAVVI